MTGNIDHFNMYKALHIIKKEIHRLCMMLNVDKQAKINMIDLNINRFDADYILLTEFTRINSKKKK